MEFKFRAVDDRPPPFPTPPSSYGYFSEQALRVSAGFPATDPRPKPEQSHNPNGPREAILQRELEKERIREEIIAAEITRRRVLEAEVRRELMMEREMAMKRLTAMGSSAEGGSLLEYRLAMHQYDGFAFPGRISAFDMFQMPLQLPEAMPLNVKQPSEINKDKLIVLGTFVDFSLPFANPLVWMERDEGGVEERE
uniref:Uncharacterized protein n=1 Tax=Fagus sylvatica TaxID=28930 RepID=A0A2N9FLT2_FAGSY